MAVTDRGRRIRYDNIAIGSATGPERTIAGETVSPTEQYGGGHGTSTSTGTAWHTAVAVGVSTSNQVQDNAQVGAAAGEENVDSTSNTTT